MSPLISAARSLAVVLAVWSTASLAQRNPELEKAQQLLAQKKYAEALKSLDAAAKKGGLERDSLLTLLESRGLAEASLGQAEQAEISFRSVLQLDAKRELTGKYTGKAATAVAAAKDWVKANGTIELGPLDPGVQDGRVKQVSLFVKNDPLKLITQARIYVRTDGGAWKPMEARVINGAAAIDLDAATVEWWAEAQSDRKDQLLFLASAGRPIKQSAPPPAAVAKVETKVEDAPKAAEGTKASTLTPAAPVKETPAVAATEPEMKSSPLRPIGYVLMGVGVAAAGVGVGFGVVSNGEREGVKAELAKGGYDATALYQRDQAAIGKAQVANVLMIAGGAVAVTGGVLWFLGRDVAVTPTASLDGGGVTVSGRF